MHRPAQPAGAAVPGCTPPSQQAGQADAAALVPRPMALLQAGDIDGFLAAARLDGAPCIFVHVPKTAGSSLRGELAALLRPDSNIHVDYADTSRSFNDRLDDAVARFLDQAEARGIRFASGHIQARHVERIAQRLPRARFVTLLREPVARLVSDYRHQRSPKQPGHEAFRNRVPDLDAYLELRGERDKMAVHLVPQALRASEDVAACIAHVARRFDFVGIQERYELSFRTLTTLAGRPALPRLRANVADATDGAAGLAGDLPAGTIERIRALNPLDAALYDHFAARLDAVRGRLEARLPVAAGA